MVRLEMSACLKAAAPFQFPPLCKANHETVSIYETGVLKNSFELGTSSGRYQSASC